jgi:hypothetical protein
MYVCSDLKVEENKINKNINTNKVGFFSPMKLKYSIGDLKSSVEKKLEFINSYEKYEEYDKYGHSNKVFKKKSKFLKKNTNQDASVSTILDKNEKKDIILDIEHIKLNKNLNKSETSSLPAISKRKIRISQKDSM